MRIILRMRRRAVKLLLFLLAGAIVNIAVAWGCALLIEHGAAGEDCQCSKDELSILRASGWDDDPVCLTCGTIGIRWSFFLAIPANVGIWRGSMPTVAMRLKAGWPLFSMIKEITAKTAPPNYFSDAQTLDLLRQLRMGSNSLTRPARQPLPLHPIWTGFAINTLFYAGVLWLLFAGPFVLRRTIRHRHGQCVACGYPIGSSPVCTECGAAIHGTA